MSSESQSQSQPPSAIHQHATSSTCSPTESKDDLQPIDTSLCRLKTISKISKKHQRYYENVISCIHNHNHESDRIDIDTEIEGCGYNLPRDAKIIQILESLSEANSGLNQEARDKFTELYALIKSMLAHIRNGNYAIVGIVKSLHDIQLEHERKEKTIESIMKNFAKMEHDIVREKEATRRRLDRDWLQVEEAINVQLRKQDTIEAEIKALLLNKTQIESDMRERIRIEMREEIERYQLEKQQLVSQIDQLKPKLKQKGKSATESN